jgi:hypothetical protein
MTKHCKGCKFHHVAGHPKDSRLIKYNDWCCAFGKTAPKCIGHCKQQNAKELK